MKERVAVPLVLWCDSRRYGGGSGCRPSHAGVTWAQIELSVEAKFYDALAARLGPVLPICGCCCTVWWFGRGVPCHTEDVERSDEASCFTETLRQWHVDTITGWRVLERVTWHHMASNHLTLKRLYLYKQSQGFLRRHLNMFEWINLWKYLCDSSVLPWTISLWSI